MPELRYSPDPRERPLMQFASRHFQPGMRPRSSGSGGSGGGGASFPSGLTHYWRLGEAAGNSRADSVGSSTLSEIGGQVGSVAGQSGNAATFITNSNHLGNAAITITRPCSLSLWFNMTTGSADYVSLMTFAVESGNSQITVHLGSSDGTVQIADSNDFHFNPGAGSMWHNLIISIDNGTDFRVYLDGVLLGTGTQVTWTDTGTFTVGYTATDAGRTNVDEFGIFNRALTQTDVTAIWNSGAGLFP